MSDGPGYSGPELCALSAREAIGLLQSGAVSPAELIGAAASRIAQTGPSINAMVTLCEARARKMAASVDRESLLSGLPIGIKDLTAVAGVRTTWGTPAFADHIPDASDPLVTRLEDRGGVVLGKTNTPEMGAGANTFNAVFGPTRNPWDTRMNAGGSSGGAAAGLATGEVWLSLGSDRGGSLRTPASFCGIVGLRPSPGVAGGASPQLAFDTSAVQGPMARNVADCALFLDALSGFDPIWALSCPAPETSYLAQCLSAPDPIRIGFAPDLGGLAPVTAEMTDVLARAMAGLDIPGVTVDEDHPTLRDVDQTSRTLRALVFWAGARKTPDDVTRHFKPALKANIREGLALRTEDVAEAMVAQSQIYAEMQGFLARYDVLACPVTGIAPLPVEIEYPPEIAGVTSRDYLDWLRFAHPATLCGLPALSLPVGFTPSGLPVGLQLIGRPRGEGRLLQIARVLEEALALPATPIDPVHRHSPG